jgi:hypothetical protein
VRRSDPDARGNTADIEYIITEMQYQVQREDVARSSRSGLKTWQASSYRHNEGIDRLNTTAQDLPRLTRQALIDLPQSA